MYKRIIILLAVLTLLLCFFSSCSVLFKQDRQQNSPEIGNNKELEPIEPTKEIIETNSTEETTEEATEETTKAKEEENNPVFSYEEKETTSDSGKIENTEPTINTSEKNESTGTQPTVTPGKNEWIRNDDETERDE